MKTCRACSRNPRLAPRLTPSAATAACRGPATVPSNPAAASPASECQDNYIVLQNAATKSQRLLGQLQLLRGEAVAALQAGLAEGAAGAPPVGKAGAAGGALGEGAATLGGSGPSADWPSGEPCREGLDLDVEVELQLTGAVAQLSTAQGGAVPSSSGAEGAQAFEAAACAPGSGYPRTPGPADRRDGSSATPAAAAAGAVLAAGAARSAEAGAGVGTGTRAAVGGGSAPAISAADLIMLMGALCGCAAKESEMLAAIAASVQLATTQQDLYSYGMMLKLQPYMDERLVSAAEAVLAARGSRATQAAGAPAVHGSG
ncbi:hypothetical protein HYH02_007506 [Chlamydomonas schloesseri]|uniref:Uncharacterized protein n=1 Tax=Chlamydomonas schloesseri TaxID=2026947 RepID=A0A835WHE4_9CHLO|nr:hypothetical protein HYH02_007506 [Chlamydomonas schloesseri]|eukprot:KAG2447583.1 hypothetical protein HYH02_007506 [Chlamydomonas schloesseri]